MPPATNEIGSDFIELRSVDSTNNYAMGLVHAGMAQHGTMVFAHEQTKGKGQRNKQWLSQKNQNIAMSAVIEPFTLSLVQQSVFNMAVTLGVYHFFSRYAGTETTIKWPNDIYWRDRKAAGILIENIISGEKWRYAIAGIGMNINQTAFGEIHLKAVSLKQITGKAYDTLQLAKELCKDLNFIFQQLLKEPNQIISQYNSHLYQLDQKVKLKKENRVFEVIIKGVDSAGRLITHHAVEERFETGSVEWIW